MSTRGEAAPVGFAEAMIQGLAPDGGLFVPSETPQIDDAGMGEWANLTYAELASEILLLLAPDMDRGAVVEACADAYSSRVFGSDDVAPLSPIGPDTWLLELSHGPTLAFKDVAMQLLARLFEAELHRRGQKMLVLGATSGDTGSSAEHAIAGRSNIAVVMLSPWQRVSPFQAAQMYTLDEPNIVNLAIEGVFDEAQDLVKEINADAAFKARHSIGAVNSINWARIAAQIVYYVWAYLRLAPTRDRPVQFAVPTGNFGNIYAGTYARRMGLPLKFILATNENDVLDEFFRTGRYRVRRGAEVANTSSPSMDIAKASNFERFVYDLVGGDAAAVSEMWRGLAAGGVVDLAEHPAYDAVGGWMRSGSSTHERRIATIRRVAVECGRVIDPHTADGVAIGSELRDPELPLVCLETAMPAKFEATIVEALGQRPPRPAGFVGLEDLPHAVEVIPAEASAVRSAIEELSAQLA